MWEYGWWHRWRGALFRIQENKRSLQLLVHWIHQRLCKKRQRRIMMIGTWHVLAVVCLISSIILSISLWKYRQCFQGVSLNTSPHLSFWIFHRDKTFLFSLSHLIWHAFLLTTIESFFLPTLFRNISSSFFTTLFMLSMLTVPLLTLEVIIVRILAFEWPLHLFLDDFVGENKLWPLKLCSYI